MSSIRESSPLVWVRCSPVVWTGCRDIQMQGSDISYPIQLQRYKKSKSPTFNTLKTPVVPSLFPIHDYTSLVPKRFELNASSGLECLCREPPSEPT